MSGLINSEWERAKADHRTKKFIYETTFDNLKSNEPLSPFSEAAITIVGIIIEKNVHPDFAGWLAGLEPSAPDHQGIIEAGEHYLYDCEYPPEP